MRIVELAVHKRVTVFVLTALICIGGLYCYFAMPRESAPEVVVPHVFVTTPYAGVSPEDIEKSITRKIEEKLRGIEGVKKIKSLSDEGISNIDVEFLTGVDIHDALQKVKDRIDEAKRDLPADLEDDPVAEDFNFSDMPIIVFSLSGPAGQKALRDIADDLQDTIESLPGVQEVEVSGGVEREILIEIMPEKMMQYAITPGEVQSVVKAENANTSGGALRMRDGRYRLRVEGEFKTVADAEGIVVASRDGKPIYLNDIAVIRDGFKDQESLSRLDGQDAVTLQVKKRSGQNIIEVAQAALAVVEKDRHNWPAGTKFTILSNEADQIALMLKDLENNIICGFLLVLLPVMFAMGWRNSVLVAMSIPLSMLLGFIVLQALGVTLNMVVLFSLTLALGMLVDNAIVIIENTYRFMQEGVNRFEAAIAATSEVAWPIIGSALTTIVAFVPMLWWDGVMGGFMKYLPLTVIVLIAACLFVALIMNPALASVFMKVTPKGEPISAEEILKRGEHPMLNEGGAFVRLYRRILAASIGHTVRTTVCADLKSPALRRVLPFLPRLAVVAVAALSLFAFIFMWTWRVGVKTPVEFFPPVDPKQINVNFDLPEGADLEYGDGLIQEVEKRIADARYPADPATHGKTVAELAVRREKTDFLGATYAAPSDLPNVKNFFSKTTIAPGGGNFFGGQSSNTISVMAIDYEKRHPSTTTFDTQKELLARIGGIAGAKITVEYNEEGPPTGSPINVEIRGTEFEVLGRLAAIAEDFVRQVPFTRNIRNDFEQGSPTIRVDIDRKRAALLGLSTGAIGSALRTAINGTDVSEYRADEDDYDIVVRFRDADRRQVESLERLFIPSANGLVPLTTVATIRYTGGMGPITRIDHARVVTVKADIDPENTTGDTARAQLVALLAGDPLFTRDTLYQGKARCAEVVADFARPETVAFFGALGLAEWPARFAGAGDDMALVSVLNEFIKTADVRLADHRAELAGELERLRASGAIDAPRAERAAQALALPADAPERDRMRARRLFLELCAPATVAAGSPGLSLPLGYTYTFTGEQEEQDQSSAFLLWAGVLGVALIFLVLVAQFNSVVYPFIIMTSVILSLGGVFLGLGVCGMPFGIIMTGVGVISLAGVVVNNAIVLLDYTLQLIDRGMSRDEAIIAAGCTRLRPVLLTAITTLLGLIPMATGISYDFITWSMAWSSESSLWWKSMAVAVIFGLGIATMLTLIVVPVLFSILSEMAESTQTFVDAVRERYWRLFWRLTRIAPRPGEPGFPRGDELA